MAGNIAIGIQDFSTIIQGNYFYIDKTPFIKEWWDCGDSATLITRPRRFGKTLTMSMVEQFFSIDYAGRSDLFEHLAIWKEEKYRNLQGTYPVISLSFANIKEPTYELTRQKICQLLSKLYTEHVYILESGILRGSDITFFQRMLTTSENMNDVDATLALYQLSSFLYQYYGKKKVIILLDEYDTPMQEAFVDGYWDQLVCFTRSLFNSTFKTNPWLERGIMTGITRVSRESIFSDLNNLKVVTTTSDEYATAFGFTEEEVSELCERYGMDMQELKSWYDGYSFEGAPSIYSPRSVVSCMRFGKFGNYWNQTETFEALKMYIDMNFEGLRDDVLSMIAGESVPVNTGSFTNDMATFHTEDDVLTLLIHLGYLAYDYDNKTVKIPNNEVRAEYVSSVSVSDWGEVSKALKNSADTLNAIWQKRPVQVAEGIRQAHFETSHLQYNDENALSYTISLALYAARNFYTVHRELAGGQGFADLVFLPRKKFQEKPALVVELKWNESANGAIEQIKKKEYCKSLEEYKGNILLVGVNYNKKTKKHECIIEEDIK